MKKITVFLIAVTFLFGFSEIKAQRNIKIKVKHLKNDTVIIGHHFNTQLIPDDTLLLKNGVGAFRGKENYPGGMYFLFLPNRSYFDFLLDKDQDFEIQCDTSDFLKTVKYKGSAENTRFIEYQKFHYKKGQEAELVRAKIAAAGKNKAQLEKYQKEITKINEDIANYFNNIITDNKGTFFSDFLTATKPVEVPPTIKDRKKQYEYYKAHYFDNFNISDARLLRTPIYEGKIEMYMDKVVLQHHDSLIKECDILIEKSRANDELFRYMLIYLFNKYASSQLMTAENVYMHLAKKYYIPEAKWSKREFIEDLKRKVHRKRNCIVGKIAPDIEYEKVPTDTTLIDALKTELTKMKLDGNAFKKKNKDSVIVYNEKARLLSAYYEKFQRPSSLKSTKTKYTIVWFWTPDCSHCRKDTPEFYELYVKELKALDVSVQTVYLSKDINDWSKFCDDTDKWFNFIKKHKLYAEGWDNSWAPFDGFRSKFDISSSPVLYLLDENKKIIAKRIGYKQAGDMIKKLENVKEK